MSYSILKHRKSAGYTIVECDLNISRSRKTFKSSVKFGMLCEALQRYRFGPDEGLRSKGKWIHQPREVMPLSDPILSEEKD